MLRSAKARGRRLLLQLHIHLLLRVRIMFIEIWTQSFGPPRLTRMHLEQFVPWIVPFS